MSSPLPVSYMPLDADAGAATSSSPEAKDEISVSTIAATAVATGHHMFKIKGYSRLKVTHGEIGSYIESCVFKVGGQDWKIRCFLNGQSKEQAGFVAPYLCLCSSGGATGPAVHAEYEFSLVSHQGTPPAYGRRRSHGVSIFGGKGDGKEYLGWGLPRFISVKELERSMFLMDDCFELRCTVTVVEEQTVKEQAVQAGDMARLETMLCKCHDDLCKRHHDRRAETFLERFANFCYSICRGPGR